jgi:nucleoside 2-deoxyribosyltransferase
LNVGDSISSVEEDMQLPRLYITGPMSSYPDANIPEFTRVAALLRRFGYQVVSPHEVECNGSAAGGATWEEYLRADIVAMMQGADALAVLPELEGYPVSRGMRVEIALAKSLGWQVRPYTEWLQQVWFGDLKPGQMLPARVPVPAPAKV